MTQEQTKGASTQGFQNRELEQTRRSQLRCPQMRRQLLHQCERLEAGRCPMVEKHEAWRSKATESLRRWMQRSRGVQANRALLLQPAAATTWAKRHERGSTGVGLLLTFCPQLCVTCGKVPFKASANRSSYC
jgi:hypothetical protein